MPVGGAAVMFFLARVAACCDRAAFVRLGRRREWVRMTMRMLVAAPVAVRMDMINGLMVGLRIGARARGRSRRERSHSREQREREKSRPPTSHGRMVADRREGQPAMTNGRPAEPEADPKQAARLSRRPHEPSPPDRPRATNSDSVRRCSRGRHSRRSTGRIRGRDLGPWERSRWICGCHQNPCLAG